MLPASSADTHSCPLHPAPAHPLACRPDPCPPPGASCRSFTNVRPSDVRHCSGYDSMIGNPAAAHSSKFVTERTYCSRLFSAQARRSPAIRVSTTMVPTSVVVERPPIFIMIPDVGTTWILLIHPKRRVL